MSNGLVATSTYRTGGSIATFTVPIPDAAEGQSVTLLGMQVDGGLNVNWTVYVRYADTIDIYSYLIQSSGFTNSICPVKLRPSSKELLVNVFFSAVNVLLFFNVS
jgi:hypothetical protein